MLVLKTVPWIISAFVVALFATLGSAQERVPYGPPVALDAAKKIAAAAADEARRNDWRMAIAIVDNHGFLVYYERLDDTQTASSQIAMDKARTAAMFRRPTRALEDAVTSGRVAVLGLPGATPITGGLPIMRDGGVVGGIGVSGGTSEQDEMVAKAGLAALE